MFNTFQNPKKHEVYGQIVKCNVNPKKGSLDITIHHDLHYQNKICLKINISEFDDFQYLKLLMGCSIQKPKPQTESLTLPTFPNYPDMDFEDFTVSWSKKKLTTSATNIELKSTNLFQLNKNPIILRRKKQPTKGTK